MKSFEKQVIVNSFLPDVFAALLVFCYGVFSTRISFDVLVETLKLLIPIIIVFQFLLAPITDHLCYHRISERISKFYKYKTTIQDRTILFEDVIQYPVYCALMTFAYFFVGTSILVLYMFFVLNVPGNIVLLFGGEGIFGTFFASLAGFNFSEKICSEVCSDIVKSGIEKEYVMRKNYFGTRLFVQVCLYIIIPLVITSVINVGILIAGYYPFDSIGNGEPAGLQVSRMFSTCFLNSMIQVISAVLFYTNIYNKNRQMTVTLSDMTLTNFSNVNPIRTDISDEFAYNHYLVNQMISMFRSIIFQTAEFGKIINHSSSNLMRISNETESTSVEQSNGIKKIVSTMENATRLSHNIENKIIEVTEIAKTTVEKVNTGSELLEKSLNSITSIADANKITIKGIKDLYEKILSIWEVANIIDTISDQTKIIAFNAELEAISSLRENRNFKNVSSEIRRLANNTIDSTREIKARLNAIQESSDSLLKTSEESTSLIKHETELAVGLEDKFTNICNSAKSNSFASNEIKYLVEQQTKAFDQIVQTLQQISLSIQGFSLSTRTLIETARNLQENVSKIENANLSNILEPAQGD